MQMQGLRRERPLHTLPGARGGPVGWVEGVTTRVSGNGLPNTSNVYISTPFGGAGYYCRTSRLRDCVFDSRSKIPRSGDFSRILESTLGPVLRLISDLELTLGRRLRQSAALVPAEPSLLT